MEDPSSTSFPGIAPKDIPPINQVTLPVNSPPLSSSTLTYNNLSEFKYCCISLRGTDRVRLSAVPIDLYPIIRQAIIKGWGSTIQSEKDYNGAYEFKLAGNPWVGNGVDGVISRRLISSLLAILAKNGWKLIQCSTVSKTEGDKDTLIFETALPDPAPELFAITFSWSDRIRVIGAQSLVSYVRQAITSHWPKGIKVERDYYGAHEFHLEGAPWKPDSEEKQHVKLLQLQILANLRSIGFKLYASVFMSTGSYANGTPGIDLDSWFFRKVGPSWL